jgi:hypothetical protein
VLNHVGGVAANDSIAAATRPDTFVHPGTFLVVIMDKGQYDRFRSRGTGTKSLIASIGKDKYILTIGTN